ncbi:hypothetical protein BJ742DRAFT_382235 [Cladochytrium replicatum]|nr:hypothetical protein BJ742DRAFT_382235 [Cladochytrium replicatum]
MSRQLIVSTIVFFTLSVSRALGHGALTSPVPRFSPRFDNPDHTRNPLNMRTEFFPSLDETEMLVCGGINSLSESKIKPTKVQSGQTLAVEWEMGYWTGAALHQGTVDVFLRVGSGSFESVSETINLKGLTTVEQTPHGMTIKIPGGLADGTALVLRWLWVGGVTPETYVNCADLVIVGSSGSNGNEGQKIQESGSSSTTIEHLTSTTTSTSSSETATSTSKTTSASVAEPTTAVFGGNHDLMTTSTNALITTYTITLAVPGYEQGHNVPPSTPDLASINVEWWFH